MSQFGHKLILAPGRGMTMMIVMRIMKNDNDDDKGDGDEDGVDDDDDGQLL